MFVVGKYIATKVVAVGESATISLKIHSMSEKRKDEILATIAHLQPAQLAKGSELTDEEKAARLVADQTWFDALATATGQECIKSWTGVGSCDDEGNLQALPCTPENIAALMTDPAVGWKALQAVNEVNGKVVQDAGNV